MGIEEEADRTLFVRNLDSRVTEELLFELFLQGGPLIKTKIPKDADGKQKSFGFAVYKHAVSVPYAMQLLNDTTLFGRSIHVQFRSGSSHSSSPGNSQNSIPANTPNPHGQRTAIQFSSPPYTPPSLMQRFYPSPDNLQKHVMINNMMLLQMQQFHDGLSNLQQRQQGAGGSRHQDTGPYRNHPSPANSGGRSHRYTNEHGPGHHQQHGQGRNNYHHRHYDGRGGNRHHDDRGGNRGHQDGRWRRY